MNSIENLNPININNCSIFEDEIYSHKISYLSILDDVVDSFFKDYPLSNLLNKNDNFYNRKTYYYYKYNSHTYTATLINTRYMEEDTEENKLEINLINDNNNFTNLSHLKNINFDIFEGMPKLFNILTEYNTNII